MDRQSLLPLHGDLTMKQVISAYRHHQSTPMGQVLRFNGQRDLLALCIWVGMRRRAKLLLKDIMRVEEDEAFRHEGGREAFEARCMTLIKNPELVAETVASQIASLKVGKLPVSKLTS